MGVLVISKSFIVREALEMFIINNFKNYTFNSVSTLDESKNIDLSKQRLFRSNQISTFKRNCITFGFAVQSCIN